ncbi:MAG TPA: Wzz/FepE/Etk N-terminal domain-containing protein, partial [Gaiellaceae bacterium]
MSVRSPDLDAEQELDLRRYWGAVVTRWWLVLAGLLAGGLIGYIASLGAEASYSAQAVVYLGQPLSPGGGAQLQSLATNPSTVRSIVRSEAVVRRVAHETGLSPGRLRRGTSTNPVSGALVKAGQTPLVAIGVKGSPPRKVADAANLFAQIVVENVSGYVAGKIASLRGKIRQDQAEEAALRNRLAAISRALSQKNALSTTDQLIISGQAATTEQQLGSTLQDEAQAGQLLSLAQNVEKSRIVT